MFNKFVRDNATYPLSAMEIKTYPYKYTNRNITIPEHLKGCKLFEDMPVEKTNFRKDITYNKSTCTKIGQGSYGEVFESDTGSVIKQIDKFDKFDKTASFCLELTSICELSILSKNRWSNIPKLENVELSRDRKGKDIYCVQIEHGGITLLEYARQLSFQERIKVLPWIGYQLVKTALSLRSNGIVHTDIKSANVLINNDLKVSIIDFGICSFEILGQVDSYYVCDKGTTMCKDWGTYCICPPETFTLNVWSVDKFMTWSIGITLCEFLFSTHSFIYNCVMNDTEKQYYKKFYKNDNVIKNIFATFFSNKIKKFEKYLTSFHSFTELPLNIIDLLQKMMTLNYNNRATLEELIHHNSFKKFYCENDVLLNTQIIPEFKENHIKAPLLNHNINIDKFKYFRGVIVQWMFDFYDMSKKIQLFVNAVNIFDRYLSIKNVLLKDYVKLATTCIYIAQYIHKRQVLTLSNVLTSANKLNKSLLHKNGMLEPNVTWSDIVNISDDILKSFEYDLYRITFDVVLLKSGISVDMTVVANVLINNTGAYNNDMLIKKYIMMKF